MLLYKIIPERKLTLQYFEGAISIEDVFGYMRLVLSDPDYSPDYDSISDLRKAEFLFNVDELNHYIDQRFERESQERKGRTAVLTSGPYQVVVSNLFNERAERHNYFVKTFTYFSYAARWLLLDSLDEREFLRLATDPHSEGKLIRYARPQ